MRLNITRYALATLEVQKFGLDHCQRVASLLRDCCHRIIVKRHLCHKPLVCLICWGVCFFSFYVFFIISTFVVCLILVQLKMRCTTADLPLLLIIQTSKPGKWSHMSKWWVLECTYNWVLSYSVPINRQILIKMCNLWNRRWREGTKWTFVSRTPAGSLILMSLRSKISKLWYYVYKPVQTWKSV